MDWDTIELNWERYKNLAREKWHRIPDAVFQSLGGSRERLIRAIEQAYDYSNEQAQREVTHWMTGVSSPTAWDLYRRASERAVSGR